MANSLAVVNEALHHVLDLNSLLTSLLAAWIASWNPNDKKTFGYYRAGTTTTTTTTIITSTTTTANTSTMALTIAITTPLTTIITATTTTMTSRTITTTTTIVTTTQTNHQQHPISPPLPVSSSYLLFTSSVSLLLSLCLVLFLYAIRRGHRGVRSNLVAVAADRCACVRSDPKTCYWWCSVTWSPTRGCWSYDVDGRLGSVCKRHVSLLHIQGVKEEEITLQRQIFFS